MSPLRTQGRRTHSKQVHKTSHRRASTANKKPPKKLRFTVHAAPILASGPAIRTTEPTISSAQGIVKKPKQLQEPHTIVLHHELPVKGPELPVTPTTSFVQSTRTDIDKLTRILPRNEPAGGKEVETDKSFMLPIIRVGPTAYGLMQVVPTNFPSALHLAFLGGRGVEDSTSVLSSSLKASQQTFNWSSRVVDHFRRPLASSFIRHEEIKAEMRALLGRDANNDELHALLAPETQPVALDMVYSPDNLSAHYILTRTRNNKFPSDRGLVYHTDKQHSLGRVFASAVDFGHRHNGEVETEAIHFVDFGTIAPLSARSFDPTRYFEQFDDLYYYLDLFAPYIQTTHEESKRFAAQMGSLLMSSRGVVPLMRCLSRDLTINRYCEENNIPRDGRGAPNPAHFTPYPASLYSWQGVADMLHKRVSLDGLNMDPISVISQDNQQEDVETKRHYTLTTAEANRIDRAMRNQFIPASTLNYDLMEPTLLAWLLPYFYNTAKPGAPHPNLFETGSKKLTVTNFETTQLPIHGTQSNSLHWVPLHELARQADHLRPVFNRFNMTTEEKDLVYKDRGTYVRKDLISGVRQWESFYDEMNRPLKTKGNNNSPFKNDDSKAPMYSPELGKVVGSSIGYVYPLKYKHQQLLEAPKVASFLNDIQQQAWDDCFPTPEKERHFIKRIRKIPGFAQDWHVTDQLLQQYKL